ncbi:MAG: hypothetical protein EBS66_03015 [Betaproteobacteria bacterium]|nr:hypothetical protein [Betaproteobacteria bacterium]NBY08786.1 hypothetical protein [Betaproteobacteria bacterium]
MMCHLSGSSLAAALSNPFPINTRYAVPAQRLFPPNLVQMIATGEESGSLDNLLSASVTC